MSNWSFAWCFALIVYWILPDAVLTKTEMVSVIFFFVNTGAYIWDVIERVVRKYKKKKAYDKEFQKGRWII